VGGTSNHCSGNPAPWYFRTLESWHAMLRRHPSFLSAPEGHCEGAMKILRWSTWVTLLALCGCVHGYGCLLQEPIKHTLTGRIHFRSFPAADGVDTVPVLVLDRTVYVYAPAHGYQCLYATDMQLVGVSEFPQSVIENSRVSVEGSVFESTSAHEYTRFLMNVGLLLPLASAP